MPVQRIEDYALLADTQSAALVGKDGSVDWLCWPRFDSDACFAAMLGTRQHGRWLLAPEGEARVTRQYRPDTLILETTFHTLDGEVRVTDFMPPRGAQPHLIRMVEGLRGEVPMRLELLPRFGYGDRSPWTRQVRGVPSLTAGPDTLELHTPLPVETRDHGLHAAFVVRPRDRLPFTLSWHPSHLPAPQPPDCVRSLAATERWWHAWVATCRPRCAGPHAELIRRSLIVLKALTYSPTGGMVAAPTTSLPELPGGVRNWDYRYCWLRDATLTLICLLDAGYLEEAAAWRDWLLRAVAGEPEELQVAYGVAGERRLTELVLPWLPGHEGSQPVRIGNAATQQLQLDIYGEVMDCLHQARAAGLDAEQDAWRLQRGLLDWLESHWQEPDEGIWEVRGPRRPFTHSKVMAWVAVDRAVRSATQFHLDGPVQRWRALADTIHRQVCEQGYDARRNAFTQSYGDPQLDAALLMIPLVGFLPAKDPRVIGTVKAIEEDLMHDGFVYRYDSRETLDGLPPGEGVFLPCSFWLADCFAMMGRTEEAEVLFSRLVGVSNDVGLLSEEYLPAQRRLAGNFPQAFSHLALVECAQNLWRARGQPHWRARGAQAARATSFREGAGSVLGPSANTAAK